ncbi:GNAT family N-acetyltransferase [Foetidibacter luteolus]|uniref:GNAT family N-acetyltransferase n=1 Tax=Foetidibacter luteolus TaxID=2608880 RepID=UPI001A97FF7D|nr:GNAT family N-acetyltransferase [Foetidibacter luteolus]
MDWFLSGHNRFLFHITCNGLVVGYCGGFVSEYVGDGSTSGMMRHAMRQAVIGGIRKPWLIFDKNLRHFYPLVVKNFFRAAGLPRKKKLPAIQSIPAGEKKAGLVVIGVHPSHRGTPVFSLLMAEFEKQAAQRNIHKLVLTVKKDNLRAVNAYKKQHWFISVEKEDSLQMMKDINPPDET